MANKAENYMYIKPQTFYEKLNVQNKGMEKIACMKEVNPIPWELHQKRQLLVRAEEIR